MKSYRIIKNFTIVVFILIAGFIIISYILDWNWLGYKINKMEHYLKGRDAVINTYDENGQLIDRIEGRSISVSPDNKFSIKDSEGKTIDKSDVLSITIGGKQMVHVGSSLIIADKDLPNVFDAFLKTVDIKNFDRSIPIVNSMVNSIKNYTIGQNFLILIRSQSGIPLASYVGNSVSYFATDIDKSTGLIVDGKFLFIYRSDYTMYDLRLLME